jgi:hypothetical protein
LRGRKFSRKTSLLAPVAKVSREVAKQTRFAAKNMRKV